MLMETFLEILKYTLPALVVFLTVYLVLRSYFDFKQKEGLLEIRRKDQEIILPIRLQAYERMVLFLERISPVQAVFRVMEPGMSPANLQAALVQTVREEFEHNIAQQIYISHEAWGLVRNAREETVRMINSAFITLDEKSTANDLARIILESWSGMEKNPVQSAVDYLKNEVRELF
jgi:hypothetical protein